MDVPRPGSRAGGMAVPYNARPATPLGVMLNQPPAPGARSVASRGGTASQQGARLNTGMRPGTPGSGYAVVAPTDGLTIADRPVTQQGMMGMRMGAQQGPRRQVQDRNYYRDLLLRKKAELASVTEDLEAKLMAAERDSGAAQQLERAHEVLAKEVKKQQGELADLNVVLGMVHGKSTRPEDIEQEMRMLRERNDAERKRMDTAFTNRQVMEKKIKEIEKQVAAQQQDMESMLGELAPDKRNRYFELLGEHKALSAQVTRMEAELDSVTRGVADAERELSSSVVKQRALATHEQIAELDSRKQGLEDEIRTLSLSPEEQKDQLLHKIRTDKAEVERLDGVIKEMVEDVSRLESKIKMAKKASEAGGGEGAAGEFAEMESVNSEGKYETLLRQEKELNEFLDDFPEAQSRLADDIAQLQEQDAELRREIERYGVMEKNLPSRERFVEMQNELQYKEDQVQNASETSVRLQDELEARQAELEKIDNLEQKMAVEIASIQEKIDTMKAETAKYKQLDALAADEEETRNRLEVDRVRLGRYRDGLQQIVGEKAAKLDAKQSQIAGHDNFQTLEGLDERLRALLQTNFATSEYIDNKNAESDYSTIKDEILHLTHILNDEIVRAAA